DRLGDVADQGVEVLDVDADVVAGASGVGSSAVAAALAPGRLVAADAEGPVALAGQDHDAAAPVAPGRLEGIDQLVDRLGPEGVQLLRPVDGGRDDAGLVPVVADVLVGHAGCPPSGLSGAVRRGRPPGGAGTSRPGTPVRRPPRRPAAR